MADGGPSVCPQEGSRVPATMGGSQKPPHTYELLWTHSHKVPGWLYGHCGLMLHVRMSQQGPFRWSLSACAHGRGLQPGHPGRGSAASPAGLQRIRR